MLQRSLSALVLSAMCGCVGSTSTESADEGDFVGSSELGVGTVGTESGSSSGPTTSSGGLDTSDLVTDSPPDPDATPYYRYGVLDSGIIALQSTPVWAGADYSGEYESLYHNETNNLSVNGVKHLTTTSQSSDGSTRVRVTACTGASNSSLCGYIAVIPYSASAATSCTSMTESGGTVVGYTWSDNTYRTSATIVRNSSATKTGLVCMYFSGGLVTYATMSGDPARCATGRCAT